MQHFEDIARELRYAQMDGAIWKAWFWMFAPKEVDFNERVDYWRSQLIACGT